MMGWFFSSFDIQIFLECWKCFLLIHFIDWIFGTQTSKLVCGIPNSQLIKIWILWLESLKYFMGPFTTKNLFLIDLSPSTCLNYFQAAINSLNLPWSLFICPKNIESSLNFILWSLAIFWVNWISSHFMTFPKDDFMDFFPILWRFLRNFFQFFLLEKICGSRWCLY